MPPFCLTFNIWHGRKNIVEEKIVPILNELGVNMMLCDISIETKYKFRYSRQICRYW